MNAGNACAACLVDEFVRAGVRHACLAPGSRSTPLALALARSEIEVHVTLDERSAAFLALGIAKSSGLPVPVLCTSGTAAANLFPAIQEAHHSRTPLIVLTADRPPELRDTGANQTIDQVKLYGDSVRWFVEVGVPEERPDSVGYWRSLGARAVARSAGSPAGPVHLNISFREPFLPTADERFAFGIEGRPDGAPWTTHVTPDPSSQMKLHEDITARIAAAERGVVVAGPGPGAEVCTELAQRLGWPLLAEPLSNSRRGPCAISTYDALLRDRDWAERHRFDFVLRAGSLGISKPLAAAVAASPHQVLIDPDGSWLDPDRSVTTVLHAHPAALLPALPERSADSWLESWRSADDVVRRAFAEVLDETDELSEPRLARDLVATIPAGSTLVVGSSMPFRDVEWYSGPRGDVRFLGNRGTNGIDGFVSTALGVALASDGPTFALCGDLSLLHDQNGLLTEAPDANLTLIVANNDGGGIFSFLPQTDVPEFERLFGTPHGLDLGALVRAHGCEHALVTSSVELRDALLSPNPGPKPRIVEVRTNRGSNVEIHRRLQVAASEALRAAGYDTFRYGK